MAGRERKGAKFDVRIEVALLERLDEARGWMPRNQWVRAAIAEKLGREAPVARVSPAGGVVPAAVGGEGEVVRAEVARASRVLRPEFNRATVLGDEVRSVPRRS